MDTDILETQLDALHISSNDKGIKFNKMKLNPLIDEQTYNLIISSDSFKQLFESLKLGDYHRNYNIYDCTLCGNTLKSAQLYNEHIVICATNYVHFISQPETNVPIEHIIDNQDEDMDDETDDETDNESDNESDDSDDEEEKRDEKVIKCDFCFKKFENIDKDYHHHVLCCFSKMLNVDIDNISYFEHLSKQEIEHAIYTLTSQECEKLCTKLDFRRFIRKSVGIFETVEFTSIQKYLLNRIDEKLKLNEALKNNNRELLINLFENYTIETLEQFFKNHCFNKPKYLELIKVLDPNYTPKYNTTVKSIKEHIFQILVKS